MDKPNPAELAVFREEKFRTPSTVEKELGLWVDRIGEGVAQERPPRLRILGQYCHVIILEGQGVYISQLFGTHAVSQGDSFVQFPEDPCAYYPHGTWTSCWITWNGPEADTLRALDFISSGKPVFKDPDKTIAKSYHQLLPIMQRGDRADALRRKTIVLQMILSLHDVQNRIAGTTLGQPRIEEALQLIHSRYNSELSISHLAGEVNLSPTHFRRMFHAYTGRSPLEYIVDLRMAEAKRLLREGLPIKRVSDEVGYTDPFYFMRVFRKNVGTPPGAYALRNSPPL